jgi:hypothetical protein
VLIGPPNEQICLAATSDTDFDTPTPQAGAAWRSLLSACAAVYGVAIGISTHPLWIRPAPARQLPGFMKNIMNVDAHAPVEFFTSIIVLAILSAMASRPVIAMLIRSESQPWSRYVAALAMIEALWYVSVAPGASVDGRAHRHCADGVCVIEASRSADQQS